VTCRAPLKYRRNVAESLTVASPHTTPGSSEPPAPLDPKWDESVLDFYTLPAETRRAPRTSILLLAGLLLVTLVGRAGLQAPFVWDDRQLATTHSAASAEEDGVGVLAAFTTPFWGADRSVGYGGYYRPVANLSFELDRKIWQDDPYGFHLTNLLLHLLACALLFGVATRAGAPPLAAAVAMLLFGVAPRLTESFIWISGRTDVLASVFVLAALYVYREEPGAAPRRMAAALCLLAGMLAKEVALTGVAAISAFEFVRLWRQRNTRCECTLALPPRTRLRNLAPIWAVTGLYLAARSVVLWGQDGPGIELSFGERLALVGETLGRYSSMILDPLHPALRIGATRAPRDAAFILAGVASLCLGIWLFKRAFQSDQSGERVGAIALVAMPLVMVLHIVPIGLDVVAADRFLYLPLAGIAIYLAIAASWLSTRNARLVLAGGCVIALSFAWSTLQRAEEWNDELVLWHQASLEADPYDSLPESWIGTLLLERGHPREALAHFQEALRIEHDMPNARGRVRLTIEYLAKTGRALAEVGRYTEAVHAISQAREIAPQDASVRAEHARALARVLRLDEALSEALAALELPSADPAPHELARVVLTAREHWLALPPWTPNEANNLSIARSQIFAALGANRQAEAIWKTVLDSPDLTRDEMLEAARYLAFNARPELAEPVVTRLIEVDGPHGAEARALSEVVEARRQRRLREHVPPTLLGVPPTLASS
jgi:tetratricopeptide (TPR) repeat protein